MKTADQHNPVHYKGVMVSSTFTDLTRHREALIKAINAQSLKPVVMENDAAKPGLDVIESSFQMVRDASAYIGVISHKYGQIPESSEHNPDRLSLTELEFREAQRLNRPVLLFIMGENHDIKLADVETDSEKIDKLKAFREYAKRLEPDSSVHRIYKVFNDIGDFKEAVVQSITNLREYLDEQDKLEVPPNGAKLMGDDDSGNTGSKMVQHKDDETVKREFSIGDLRLTILFGDIAQSEDQVIVSSDDYDLSATGGVSKAIRSAGGEAITNDTNKLIPLTLGEVLPTTAGNLPARYIFHAVTIGPDPTDKYVGSRKKPLTKGLADKCMQLMKVLGQRSIAFPALGTGYAKFPLKLSEVTSEMIKTITEHIGDKNLAVTIYIYNDEIDRTVFFDEVVFSTPELKE